MNKFLLGLFVLTSASSHDPDRTYSSINKKSNEHIRLLTPPLGDFTARITKSNLECLTFLQKQNLFLTLLPPQIKTITNDAIISILHTINDPEKEYIQFIKHLKKKSSQQLKNDLALASIMGVAGDLAPTNTPEYPGEVNAVVVYDKKIQILDIDNLSLEIEPLEFFLYGVDAFKTSLQSLEDDDLKKIALLRLQKIFPQKTKAEIKTIFDEKIELIKQATTNRVIESFFKNQDNYNQILDFQDGKITINQISSQEVINWLNEMSIFNQKALMLESIQYNQLSSANAKPLSSEPKILEL